MEIRHSDDTGCADSHCYQLRRYQLHELRAGIPPGRLHLRPGLLHRQSNKNKLSLSLTEKGIHLHGCLFLGDRGSYQSCAMVFT